MGENVVDENRDISAIEEWVTFEVRNEVYAIEVTHVKEINTISDIFDVPGSPSSVIGIIQLRGEVISIVDGAQLLGSKPFIENEERRIIILEFDDSYMGLMVNDVKEIVRFSQQDISSNTQSTSPSEMILGTIQINDKLVIPLKLNPQLMVGDE